jgi:hypothetical protein
MIRVPHCPGGEIGRRKGLKIPRDLHPVPVRVRPRAPSSAATGSLLMTTPQLLPRALFDTLENFEDNLSPGVVDYLHTTAIPEAETEFQITRTFLSSYTGSADTFNAYRREVERLLHWAWLVAKKSIKQLDRGDIRQFIDFCQQPPPAWIGVKNAKRFLLKEGLRIHNPEWRPFVVRLSKMQFKSGKIPHRSEYALTNKSMQALFAGMGTYYTFLQQEGYVAINPVQLVRQKSRYIQKQQTQKITRKLSHLQWQTVIETIERLAKEEGRYERHLFLMSAFYLLGLRISELAETPGRIPNPGCGSTRCHVGSLKALSARVRIDSVTCTRRTNAAGE